MKRFEQAIRQPADPLPDEAPETGHHR